MTAPGGKSGPASAQTATVDEALVWLSAIRPSALLDLLKEPQYILISQRAFAGFRANHQGLAFPTVRRRLALEAVNQLEFGQKLRSLYESAAVSASNQRSAEKPKSPSSSDAASAQQRERDKRKIAELQSRAQTAEASETRLKSKNKELENDVARLNELVSAQEQRLERLEKQLKRRETEQAELLKLLRERAPAGRRENPKDRLEMTQGASPPSAGPWMEAIRRNLELGHVDVVVPILNQAYRSDPDHAEVLELAADLSQKRGDRKAEADFLRQLVTARTTSGQGDQALSAWARLSILAPTDPFAAKSLPAVAALVSFREDTDLQTIRAILARVKVAAPNLHSRLVVSLSKRRDLAPLFETAAAPSRAEKESIHIAGKPIPLQSIVSAIDRGDAALVFKVADGIKEIQRTDPDSAETMLRAIADHGGDPSYRVPLTAEAKRLKPAIVDASNIAWIGQEDLPKGHPRLNQILDVRRALRENGYFPILLYADANLPYSIDDKEAFQALVEKGEAHRVDAGVDADEEIIRDAKRMAATIISNDYMGDWDPANTVPKIGITLSRTGKVSLIYR